MINKLLKMPPKDGPSIEDIENVIKNKIANGTLRLPIQDDASLDTLVKDSCREDSPVLSREKLDALRNVGYDQYMKLVHMVAGKIYREKTPGLYYSESEGSIQRGIPEDTPQSMLRTLSNPQTPQGSVMSLAYHTLGISEEEKLKINRKLNALVDTVLANEPFGTQGRPR